jgi:hypothetical protein
MILRPARIAAIAWRDLKIEYAGRRAWALPLVALGLLLPGALAPPVPEDVTESAYIRVTGDVPSEVAALGDRYIPDPSGGNLRFERVDDPSSPTRMVVHGTFLLQDLSDVLDRLYPPFHTVVLRRLAFVPPERSLLLSMIAASLLTGAIAQSLPGERSARTLETLLTAGISREELVLGKWIAWGGLGALAGLAACGLAVAAGHQTGGWYLLPVPFVSFANAALGFWMVRRANDVIGGATVAIRVLPATMFISAGVAWLLGRAHPLLGAAVPLGGALAAAGNLWPGPAPALLATVVTGATTAGLLWATQRDLADAERSADDTGAPTAVAHALGISAAWAAALVAPLLWSWGGNPTLIATMPASEGAWCGAALVLAYAGTLWARSADPSTDLGARGWTPRGVAEGALAGGALALLGALPTLGAAPGLLGEAGARMHAGLQGAPWAAAIAVGVAEITLQGPIRRRAGPALALLASASLLTPLDPARALTAGVISAALTSRHEHAAPGALARVLALLPFFLGVA